MHTPLLGSWSAEVLYGFGPMSDYILTFLPDHTGYFEEINVELYAYETLSWATSEDGTLSITAISRCFKGNGEEGTDPGTISVHEAPYSITHEPAPTGETMDILSISLAPGSPWSGFPDRFGRMCSLEDLIKYPRTPTFP